MSNRICWECNQRIDEECGIDGHEVYEDDLNEKICFESKDWESEVEG
jgi:hypothetical protein